MENLNAGRDVGTSQNEIVADGFSRTVTNRAAFESHLERKLSQPSVKGI
jgi:hypothetical protein